MGAMKKVIVEFEVNEESIQPAGIESGEYIKNLLEDTDAPVVVGRNRALDYEEPDDEMALDLIEMILEGEENAVDF